MSAEAVRSAAPPTRTLDEIIAMTLRGPKAAMAAADTAGAAARVDEADAARLPRIKATAFATLSPEIRCEDADCIRTDPDEFALRFSGGFFGGSLEVVQPIYTFGKISSARRAARAGVDAQLAPWSPPPWPARPWRWCSTARAASAAPGRRPPRCCCTGH